MKKIILSFLVLITLSSANAAITIVSDLDDTIKITSSGREVDRTYNGLFTNLVFTGMPEFFAAARSYTDELHVVSASPLMLRQKILFSLNKKKIKIDSLTLKNIWSGESKLDYKVKAVKRLMTDNSDDFILIGDDVDYDPEVYDVITKEFPNRVLAIYIHVIRGRDLPETSVPYYTSFDLLLREYLAGRMAKEAVDKGVDLLKDEKKMQLVFPKFAVCPKTPAVWLWQVPTSYVVSAAALTTKFNLHCLSEYSGN